MTSVSEPHAGFQAPLGCHAGGYRAYLALAVNDGNGRRYLQAPTGAECTLWIVDGTKIEIVLEVIRSRVEEPELTYEALLNDLKKHGKI